MTSIKLHRNCFFGKELFFKNFELIERSFNEIEVNNEKIFSLSSDTYHRDNAPVWESTLIIFKFVDFRIVYFTKSY